MFDPNDPAFRELVDLFVSELEDRAEAIDAAVGAGDREVAARLAHQLKGAAGCYGFDRLTALAAALQVACEQKIGEQARVAADRLCRACEEVTASHGVEPSVGPPVGP